MIGTLHHWLTVWWPLVGHLSGATLTIVALLAFAFATPAWLLPAAKKPALWAAATIAIGMAVFVYGDKTGADRVKANWDWSLGVEAEKGEQIRKDADAAVRAEPPDSVRNDPRNRDNGKQPDGN